jgi:hypothetical protein
MNRVRAWGGMGALIVAVTLLGGLGGVFVEQMYCLCLSAKGWVRDKQYDPPPPGWYRGVE